MSKQDQALHLADECADGIVDFAEAAAELRRLHAENEAAHAVGIRQEQELMNCKAQRDELLVALDKVREMPQWEHVAVGIRTKIEAAIAKVEGGAA